MKKKTSRLLACLLACLLAVSPMAACNDDGTETESDSVSESAPESLPDIVEVPDVAIAGADIADFSVVIPTDMPAGQVTAVDDFILWVEKATGHKLPKLTADQSAEHEIIIGQNVRENEKVTAAVSEIKNDGYAYVVDGGDLYITASTGRGVVYGLYDFLENYMGVRFYTENYTHLREFGNVALDEGMKEIFSPVMSARWLWAAGLAHHDNWYFFQTKNNVMLEKRDVGDTISISTNSNHTFPGLAGTEQAGAVMPCTFDPAVYETVKSQVLAGLEAYPEQNAIQVGQGDGFANCSCDKCTAFIAEHGNSRMAPLLDFCNRLGDEVAALYPGVKIITYSYQYSHVVPDNMEVSDNVIIDFCLDEACFKHALTDPDCEKNVKVAAEFRRWAELCHADNLFVYDYAWNCGSGPLLDPNLYVMWDNFQFYKELGVTGILSEGCFSKGGDLDHLRYYLRSKLSWDMDMTKEEYFALMDEFLQDYYGDAAPAMKQYLDLLYLPENMTENCSAMYAPWEAFFSIVDENGNRDLTELRNRYTIFTEALKIETLTDDRRAHVEYASMHLLSYLKDLLQGKERRKLEAVWDDLVAKYGLPDGTIA